MNNVTLSKLQEHIFAAIERMGDETLTGDDAKIEIAKAMALSSLGKDAIANMAFQAKYAEQNGLNVELPVFADKPKKLVVTK